VTLSSQADRHRPTYAAAFRCIGPECEDTCCHGWNIPLDRQTYEKYQLFPIEKLGAVVRQHVSVTPGAHENLYARINLEASGDCPFLDTDRLCGIQKEYGGELLSATCSIFPRTLNRVDGVMEGSLTLSCPEAARNVLLHRDAMQVHGDLLSGEFRTDSVALLALNESSPIYKPYAHFHAVREMLIEMVQDRARPMSQRLLLIGSLCKRLDAMTPDQDAMVPAMLDEYRQVITNRWLHAELDAMPSHVSLKLKLIFQLSDHRVRDKSSGKRFQDVFWMFVEGIGSPSESGMQDDAQRFQQAEKNYYRPFFASAPYILENYLLNYMYQTLFPFGREGSPSFTPQGIFDEYVLMTTQFAWVNALLIGVAGRYQHAFGEQQVVRTIQAFTRAVEHNPHVLQWINQEMKRLKMDSLEGMSILLKNDFKPA
jgi:lysine-N-methylase